MKKLERLSFLKTKQVQIRFRRLLAWAKNNPARFSGLIILIGVISIAILASFIAPYDPQKTGIPFQYPSLSHLLGTDDLGHDIFSQVLYGARVSLTVGFLAATVTMFIGILIGLIAGYYRGWLEELLMSITDVYLLLPGLPLMILLAAYLSPSIWNIVFVIGLLWWCPIARVIHARVLQVREMDYIYSTKTLGYSNKYIMLKHVIINTKDVILAKFSLTVASAMLSEASLSFLGLGDPFNVSWGQIISFSFSCGGFTNDLWWWYMAPGIMISLSVLAFLLIGTERKAEKNNLIEV